MISGGGNRRIGRSNLPSLPVVSPENFGPQSSSKKVIRSVPQKHQLLGFTHVYPNLSNPPIFFLNSHEMSSHSAIFLRLLPALFRDVPFCTGHHESLGGRRQRQGPSYPEVGFSRWYSVFFIPFIELLIRYTKGHMLFIIHNSLFRIK